MDNLIQTLAFPYSALLAVVFLLTVFAVHRFAGKMRFVKALSALRTARILLAIGAVLLGLEGTWSLPVHNSWYFLVYVLTLLTSLELVILDGFRRKAKAGFLLNHLGIFLIIWGAFFGAPDVLRGRLVVGKEQTVNKAVLNNGRYLRLPFEVSLTDFCIDYYTDGVSPRQFTSHLLVEGEKREVSVNHPISCQGYTLFQQSYDGRAMRYTVLQVVRDPWLPVVYLGMALLAIGSILLLFGKWKLKLVLPITLLLTTLFTYLTLAKINFGTLMPALRSWWFVPHLFIYMVAYSLMAFALIMWIVKASTRNDRWLELSNNLMRSSAALLIIGMLTGSVWARQAWGDYWAWDPKENWAAVTWLVALMHLHLQQKRGWRGIVILVLAFLALQITWYGVNYLPSAMDSLHTYME